jgi:hypothetical protein
MSASRLVRLRFRGSAISSRRSSGWAATNSGSAGASSRLTTIGTEVSRTVPATAASAPAMRLCSPCISRSTRSAWAMATSPAGVGRIARSTRSNSRVPSAVSAAASRRATVVSSTRSRRAAAESVPPCATARR